MAEHLQITGAEAGVGVSFARAKVRQLRTLGQDNVSKTFRFFGYTVFVRINGPDEYIWVNSCSPQAGYLITVSFEPSEFPEFPATPIFWATFPTFKKHANGGTNGTYRITSSTTQEQSAELEWPSNILGVTGSPYPIEWADGEDRTKPPKGYPTFGVHNPISAMGEGPDARWPSLFSGYMRLVAQMALASSHGNVFSHKWGGCHGALPVRGGSGKVTSIWIIEISNGIYAAEMPARCGIPDVEKFVADLLPTESERAYSMTFPGMVSLGWVFNFRAGQTMVRKLSGEGGYSAQGSPLSLHRGWAFNYSGTRAECILFGPTAKNSAGSPGSENAHRIEHLAIDIQVGDDGPISAETSVVQIIDPFVNVTGLLLWHPADDRLFNWKQLPVMGAKLLHPPTPCSNVPLDVYFVGDTAQYTRVSQGFDVGAPAIITDGASSCLDWWRAAKPTFGPSGGGGASGGYWLKEDSRSPNVDRIGSFATPAGNYTDAPVGGVKISNWTANYSGSASWLASKTFSPFVGYFLNYEQFGWQVVIRTEEEEGATSRQAAVILNYFDRESMFLVHRKEDIVRSSTGTEVKWVFSANAQEQVSFGEYDAAVAGTSGTPSRGYPPVEACHRPISGRFTSLGGYNEGTDPAPTSVESVSLSEQFEISHAMPGGAVYAGGVKDEDKGFLSWMLTFRNPLFGMDPYEGVAFYSMSSAACTIAVPAPNSYEDRTIGGSHIRSDRIAEGTEYSGPIPEPTGPTAYKGYAGAI